MAAHGYDFRSLRHWDGSQHRAFEELCYQLRDRTLDGPVLVKTGNPDAGLEWYVTRRGGTLWGWQAKYTFDIDTALKLMERSLMTVVRERPTCRRLTFCIPFDLPDAPGRGARKSARRKFEERKESWRLRIAGANRVRIELWSAGNLLERLVCHPSQRGIARFFWGREIFSPAWCSERVNATLDAAGGRYSPDLHVDLPLAFSLEGLARSDAYKRRYRKLRDAVAVAARKIQVSHHTGLDVTNELRSLVHAIAEWRRDVPDDVAPLARLCRDQLLEVTAAFWRAVNEAYSPDSPRRKRKATARQARDEEREYLLRHYLTTLRRALDTFETFLQSGASKAAERGALVLTGEAGQGKTHLFCDAARRAVDAGQPTIVLLAGRLSGRRVWHEIGEQLGLAEAGREVVIGAMEAAAQASNAPFLLLIDALNEADEPKAWQEELPALLADIARSPWISLGVSIRSTFLPIVLPVDGLAGVAEVEHRGFERRELEATERFFDAFGLDQPQIPFLTPEFTNPLFLKLYCEGLQELGLRAPSAGEDHVSGVFDRYLASKAERIASRLNLDPATQPVEKAIDAFCKALARDNRDSLAREQSTQLINAFAPGRDRWPDTLLGQLLAEGVLTADVAWRRDAAERVQVVRFTYQRIADYRVAAAFLEPLNGDPALLREALAAGRPLRKRVLKAPAAWVETLSVLVPERFAMELLDAASWRLDSSTRRRWDRAFVQSISVRRPVTVTARTRELLSLVSRRSRWLRKLVLDTLLTVAPVPEHPLNETLHKNLKNWSMPVRDVAWTIPTYFAFHSGGPLDRIIRWAARGPYPDCPEQVVEAAAVPIVWTFTSPNRRMRDYATKALAQLLSGSLAALPPLIRRFDGVDDPYVIERLAVVSHGAVLLGGRKAESAAVAAARDLKHVAFGATQIPNIITWDAVRGVHEWCFRHGLIDNREYEKTLPPYGADPPGKPRTEKQLDRAYGSRQYRRANVRSPYADVFMSIFMMGDFGRYVIETKLRDFSDRPRRPIRPDARPPEQGRVAQYPTERAKCWVFERVLSLGWTPQRFAGFDSHRAPRPISRLGHKAERFGKKYQWIALRELVARVADNFFMADGFGGRPRTFAGPWQIYGRDIDPTLPPPPLLRNEHDDSELGPTFTSDDESWWVTPGPSYGPDDPPVGDGWAVGQGDVPEFEPMVKRNDEGGTRWVVLHAYHNWDERIPKDEERTSRRRRKFWSHVYSWLVQPEDRGALVAHLEQRSLMGRWMPEGDDYTDAAYLGELTWAMAAKEEEPDPQREIEMGDGVESKPVKACPAWEEFCWEGNVLDCSVDDGVTAEMPNRILFEAGKLEWVPGTRAWCGSDGRTVAQYLDKDGHGVLLVRENWLKRTLRDCGCSMVFGWLGEKQLFESGSWPQLVGDWMEINAIASLDDGRWTFGQRRLERRSVDRTRRARET